MRMNIALLSLSLSSKPAVHWKLGEMTHTAAFDEFKYHSLSKACPQCTPVHGLGCAPGCHLASRSAFSFATRIPWALLTFEESVFADLYERPEAPLLYSHPAETAC